MSGLLDYTQTSGNDWGGPPSEALYHWNQEPAQRPEARQQLADFADLEAQMARFEAKHEALIADVRRHYVFTDDLSLTNFFRSHRTLPQLLIQAIPHLGKHFGTNTVFHLRAPIDASGSQTLYAVAMWPGSPNDVRRSLANLDESWWFDIVRQATGNLTFTYELV